MCGCSSSALQLERKHAVSKVLVLYYSSYGHIEKMAEAVAEGARSAGAQVDVKRVPETVPEAIARSGHFNLTSRLRWQRWLSWRIMTQSSSVPGPVSVGCRRGWRPSSIRPAGCGRAAR